MPGLKPMSSPAARRIQPVPVRFRLYRSGNLAADELGDVEVILLDHHHVTVTGDSNFFEPDKFGRYSRLREVLWQTVLSGGHEAGLPDDVEHGNARQPRQLPGAAALHITADEPWA